MSIDATVSCPRNAAPFRNPNLADATLLADASAIAVAIAVAVALALALAVSISFAVAVANRINRTSAHQTHRASPMDGRRFPPRHGWRVGKSSTHFQLMARALARKRFSLVPFLLTLIKRNEPARSWRAEAPDLAVASRRAEAPDLAIASRRAEAPDLAVASKRNRIPAKETERSSA